MYCAACTSTSANQSGANPGSECTDRGPQQNGVRGQPGQEQAGSDEQQAGDHEKVSTPLSLPNLYSKTHL